MQASALLAVQSLRPCDILLMGKTFLMAALGDSKENSSLSSTPVPCGFHPGLRSQGDSGSIRTSWKHLQWQSCLEWPQKDNTVQSCAHLSSLFFSTSFVSSDLAVHNLSFKTTSLYWPTPSALMSSVVPHLPRCCFSALTRTQRVSFNPFIVSWLRRIFWLKIFPCEVVKISVNGMHPWHRGIWVQCVKLIQTSLISSIFISLTTTVSHMDPGTDTEPMTWERIPGLITASLVISSLLSALGLAISKKGFVLMVEREEPFVPMLGIFLCLLSAFSPSSRVLPTFFFLVS